MYTYMWRLYILNRYVHVRVETVIDDIQYISFYMHDNHNLDRKNKIVSSMALFYSMGPSVDWVWDIDWMQVSIWIFPREK